MARQIKGLLYFFITDIRHSLMIFWTILLSILVVSLAFSYFLLSVEDGKYFFAFTIPIYVYCAIVGFLTVKDNIPFALKIGATRKNIFISIGLFFLGLAFVKSIIANTLHALTLLFTEATGIHTFHFIHAASLLQDTWLTRVFVDASIAFFFFAVMFIVGLLFYKYGLAGGGSVAGVVVVVLLLGIAQGWIFDFFVEVISDLKLTFFFQMLGVGIGIYIISFLLVRRITTVKVK
ncbi:hypothetical protein CIL05_18630 [Virgibacillus profundi]|uniref:Uncharacterized protein n=1 Tax=Virgibacillus profundi TaxID=2024555 RepID=A0A2A2IAN9_9BACI|nr:hypothetical protein [Virgibacillus profundi]PAV28123.1 hypothetical protein CIL05_18630 [Virgibacillus profundi]PXY52428.1 hypothetical protein CIT14_18080 [Virgibacillus profundi]